MGVGVGTPRAYIRVVTATANRARGLPSAATAKHAPSAARACRHVRTRTRARTSRVSGAGEAGVQGQDSREVADRICPTTRRARRCISAGTPAGWPVPSAQLTRILTCSYYVAGRAPCSCVANQPLLRVLPRGLYTGCWGLGSMSRHGRDKGHNLEIGRASQAHTHGCRGWPRRCRPILC